jgi:hypothetical protein
MFLAAVHSGNIPVIVKDFNVQNTQVVPPIIPVTRVVDPDPDWIRIQ